jgi:hypothetical protein
MATNGFEFAYSLDGSVPVVRDLPVTGTNTYKSGDLVVLSSGKLAKVSNSVSTVSAVLQESRESGADGDLMKAAIITTAQVWRASMDAATYSASIGAETQDVAGSRLLDANDASGGSLALVEVRDDPHDTNPIGYVVFTNVSFG